MPAILPPWITASCDKISAERTGDLAPATPPTACPAIDRLDQDYRRRQGALGRDGQADLGQCRAGYLDAGDSRLGQADPAGPALAGCHVGDPVAPPRVEPRHAQGDRLVVPGLVQLDIAHQGRRPVRGDHAMHPRGVVGGVDPYHAAGVDEGAVPLVELDPARQLGQIPVVELGDVGLDAEVPEQGGGAAQ